MQFSKGNWSIGKISFPSGTVVTDDKDGFEIALGHDDINYYGGYLICESILKKADADLISQAPRMYGIILDAIKLCQEYILPDSKITDADFGTRVIGIFDNSEIMQVLRTIEPEKWEGK